ncbi:hypothetical protein AOQ84DRAFT_345413 [Glonium stellatum]|uniref:DUF7707 domain-containing protein n=1 Tax=Glonium stellatum TaxID=574774 RepID=A0A8E2JPQ9_9PEZI|nr:hypothetical protein AOQ84DRAFT_345413 [Glonium stellatum]
MFYSTLLLAATAFTGLVAAQNFSQCCTLPTLPPIATRQTWCRAEQNTCPELCGGIGKLAQNGNLCDSNALTYTCQCSDGTSPNISDYQQSLPALMCEQWKTDCVANSPNDLTGQTACLSVVCGNKTTDDLSSSSSSAPSATAAPSSTSGGNPSATVASATSSSSKAAATALALAKEFGTPALAMGIAAAFGLAL